MIPADTHLDAPSRLRPIDRRQPRRARALPPGPSAHRWRCHPVFTSGRRGGPAFSEAPVGTACTDLARLASPPRIWRRLPQATPGGAAVCSHSGRRLHHLGPCDRPVGRLCPHRERLCGQAGDVRRPRAMRRRHLPVLVDEKSHPVLGRNHMLTRAALKNPYAVFALCMIALVLGAVSYKKMRVDIFPEIKIPTILVTTFYRGLSPSEMEGAITLRMEQRFVEASYVEHIESQSLAGMSYIKVFFQPEYGIDAAQSELTSLAYSIIRLLPPGVYPPSVYKFGVASLPIGFLSINSENLGPKEIRDLAYFTVRNQIASIPGISFGPPLGGKVRQITIFMDQQRMLARGVSPSDVVKAINAQSAIIPAGDIKIGDLDYYVYSNSLIDLVEKINDIPIKMVNGTPILVRDIGTAADSAAIQTSIVRVNGREATYIPITRQEGANTLEVTDGIRAKLPELTEIPAGATVKFIYDQSLY